MSTITAPRNAGDTSPAVAALTRSMWQALLWRVSGYIEDEANAWRVSVTSGATIAVGAVGDRYVVRGYLTEITGVASFTLSSLGTQPTGAQVRIDRVVARLDRLTGQVAEVVIPGVPAAAGSAVAPAVVRNSTTWDASLATVRRTATAPLVISPGDVTDTRTAAPEGATPPVASRWASYTSAAARDAANPSAVDGTVAYLEDTDRATLRRNGAWAGLVTADRTEMASFATASARDSAWTAPVDGSLAYVEDVDRLTVRVNGSWLEIPAGQGSEATGTVTLQSPYAGSTVAVHRVGSLAYFSGIAQRTAGALIPSNDVVGNVPVGFRPPVTRQVAAQIFKDAPTQLLITASGDITVGGGVGTNTSFPYLYLDGVSYRL